MFDQVSLVEILLKICVLGQRGVNPKCFYLLILNCIKICTIFDNIVKPILRNRSDKQPVCQFENNCLFECSLNSKYAAYKPTFGQFKNKSLFKCYQKDMTKYKCIRLFCCIWKDKYIDSWVNTVS